jgi:hypothetical protein
MSLDDGFNADNPYHSVALIYAGFTCEECGLYCSGEPEGVHEQTPYKIMAEIAEQAGWLVRSRDAAQYDYLILCPSCARGRTTADDNQSHK